MNVLIHSPLLVGMIISNVSNVYLHTLRYFIAYNRALRLSMLMVLRFINGVDLVWVVIIQILIK